MEVFTLKLQLQTSGSEINWVYFLMNRFIYKTANFARDLRRIWRTIKKYISYVNNNHCARGQYALQK